MSTQTWANAGFGIVIKPQDSNEFLKTINKHVTLNNEEPFESINDAVDGYLNELDTCWFDINDTSSAYGCWIKYDKSQKVEDLYEGLLYIPFGIKTPSEEPYNKNQMVNKIKKEIGHLLPQNYSIDCNFVFATFVTTY